MLTYVGQRGGRLCLSGQACHVPTESLLLREHVKSDCGEAGLGMWNCHSKFWVTISFEWCFHEQGNEYVSSLRCGLQTFSFAMLWNSGAVVITQLRFWGVSVLTYMILQMYVAGWS